MNDAELVIEVPSIPPTANTMWREGPYGRIYLTAEARNWRKLVALSLRSATRDWRFFEVRIEIYMPNRRICDVDNRIKPTLDALTCAGLWKDDSQVAFVSCEFVGVDKIRPRTVVIIRERATKFRDDPKP